MIIARLIDLIRFESGVSGTISATAFIYETLLEILRDATAIDTYQELLQVNTDLVISSDVFPAAALPSDYQHLKDERVRYLPSASEDNMFFLLESEYNDSRNSGLPNRYQLTGGTILPYPNATDVALGDIIRIDYYKAITSLAFTDDFPVPSLQGMVKKECISRLKRLMGKNGQADDADAQRSLVISKGDGTTSK